MGQDESGKRKNLWKWGGKYCMLYNVESNRVYYPKRKGEILPEISRFLGIIILMYYRDHAPPHFHAKYGDYEIVVYIEDGVVEGKFPRRALNHVLEWYEKYRDALSENWQLSEDRKPLNKIPPLE